MTPYNSMGNNPIKIIDPEGDFLFFTNFGYELQKHISPIAVKFNLGFSDGSWGFETSIGLPQSMPFSYRGHFGADYFSGSGSYDGMVQGWQTSKGREVSFFNKFALTSTTYSSKDRDGNSTSQTTGMVRLGGFLLNAKYQNDWWPGAVRDIGNVFGLKMGDGGDRWRTGAGQINLGPFLSIGANMGTGDPLNRFGKPESEMVNGHETYVSKNGSSPDRYRVGTFYLRFGFLRLGKDSERFRAKVQNELIHDGLPNAHWFQEKEEYNEFYWYFGNGPGSGLW